MPAVSSNNRSRDANLNLKQILPVLVIVFVDLLGLTIIIPLLPLYAVSFGANAFTIGVLGATYPLLQFIGAPILGRLSDRYGRRPVLLVSQIGTFIGFLVLGFSKTLWVVFLSRAIDGISGANIATAQAVISDSTTERTRTQGLGLIGAAFGIGFIIGPVIAFATLALTGDNYAMVAFVAAAFSLGSILLTAFWLEETLPEAARTKGSRSSFGGLNAMLAALRKPQIGFLLTLMFAQQFAFGGFEQLLALFTLERLGLNASGNAVLFVYAGVIIVVVQAGLLGRWSRRYGDRNLILFGLVILGIALTLAAFTPNQPVPWYSRVALESELGSGRSLQGESAAIRVNLPEENRRGWQGLGWLLVAILPASVGGGILQPSINSMITKRVSAEEVGGMLGISAAFFSGANAITPVVLGALFQWLGSTAPFLTGGVLLLFLWVLSRRSFDETS